MRQTQGRVHKKEASGEVKLRRSKRKVPSTKEVSTVFDTPPPSSKKARRGRSWTSIAPRSPPPSLLSLPYDVQDLLTRYLDVKSLEALAQTCSHFDLMINGRYLTSVNIPFNLKGFMAEVMRSEVLEKKPLLRLECKKLDRDRIPQPGGQEVISCQGDSLIRFMDSGFQMKQYVLEFQMGLLSLSSVREVDLVPDNIRNQVASISPVMWECAEDFDHVILSHLAGLGALKNISRLDILLGIEDISHDLWKKYLPSLTSLLELNITVLERRAGANQRQEYIYGYLEEIISDTRATRVSITVLSENKRILKLPKVFCSEHIEYLHISAPCNLSLSLRMKNLKEVSLKMTEVEGPSGNCCSYQGSRKDDRQIHRAGLCIVNLGALYGFCESLQRYNGINIGDISKSLKFPQWNSRVKKLFYEEYVRAGGQKELKDWNRKRWFSKQPSVPLVFGKARLPAFLH